MEGMSEFTGSFPRSLRTGMPHAGAESFTDNFNDKDIQRDFLCQGLFSFRQ
jgi:hypothetical protein